MIYITSFRKPVVYKKREKKLKFILEKYILEFILPESKKIFYYNETSNNVKTWFYQRQGKNCLEKNKLFSSFFFVIPN